MSFLLDPTYVDPASILLNFSESWQFNFDNPLECHVQDKGSDSGYASTSTARDNFGVDY